MYSSLAFFTPGLSLGTPTEVLGNPKELNGERRFLCSLWPNPDLDLQRKHQMGIPLVPFHSQVILLLVYRILCIKSAIANPHNLMQNCHCRFTYVNATP